MIKLPFHDKPESRRYLLENAARVFVVLNVVALLGLGAVLVSRLSLVLSYGLVAELLLLTLSLGAAYAEERHNARLQHERELVKLSKKKGVEF